MATIQTKFIINISFSRYDQYMNILKGISMQHHHCTYAFYISINIT